MKQVKCSTLNARFLFLAPPSLEELEKRLRQRGTENEDQLQKRLAQAKKELEYSKQEGVHDKVIVNEDLEEAAREMEQWVMAEEGMEASPQVALPDGTTAQAAH